jgi:hypothetical protein
MMGWDATRGDRGWPLKAEGCCAEVEIVKLVGAAPGQRNWEITTIGPNTAPPDVTRCIVDVQTRLGQKFQHPRHIPFRRALTLSFPAFNDSTGSTNADPSASFVALACGLFA